MIVITSEAAQRLTEALAALKAIEDGEPFELAKQAKARDNLAYVCNEVQLWMAAQDPMQDVPDEIVIARARTLLREYRAADETTSGETCALHLTNLDLCLQALQQRTLPRRVMTGQTECLTVDVAERDRLEKWVEIYARNAVEVFGGMSHPIEQPALEYTAELVVRMAQATLKKLDDVTK